MYTLHECVSILVYTNRRKKALYKSIAYRIVLPLPDGKREAIDEARLNDESRAPSFAPPPRTSWRVGSGRKPNDLFHSRPTARPTSSIGLSGSKTPKKPAPRAYRNRVLAALDRLPRPRPPVSAGQYCSKHWPFGRAAGTMSSANATRHGMTPRRGMLR